MEFMEFDTDLLAANPSFYSGLCGITKYFCSANKAQQPALKNPVQTRPSVGGAQQLQGGKVVAPAAVGNIKRIK